MSDDLLSTGRNLPSYDPRPDIWMCKDQVRRELEMQNHAAHVPAGCPVSSWRCESGDCIPQSAQCDGYKDCTDGTDELDCPAIRQPQSEELVFSLFPPFYDRLNIKEYNPSPPARHYLLVEMQSVWLYPVLQTEWSQLGKLFSSCVKQSQLWKWRLDLIRFCVDDLDHFSGPSHTAMGQRK